MLKLTKDEKAIRTASQAFNLLNSELGVLGLNLQDKGAKLPQKLEAIGVARLFDDPKMIDLYAKALEIHKVYWVNIKTISSLFITIDDGEIENSNTFVAIEEHAGKSRFVLLLKTRYDF